MKNAIDYYTQNFDGKYSEEFIAPFLGIAEDIILGAVIRREYSEEEENAVLKAVCIQAEEYAAAAGISETAAVASAYTAENVSADSGEVRYSSVKLGDFSVSFKDGSTDGNGSSGSSSDTGSSSVKNSAAAEKVTGICERAAAVLDRYGLFYRGGVLL